MSTTTVSYQSTTQDVELEDLRRREAEAREAARRAAAEAERERLRAEEERRRIDHANAVIAEQDELFGRVVAKLDTAAQRLPDLKLTAPKLPMLRADDASNPNRLAAFAQDMQRQVEQFERQVEEAIELAELLLQRRIAKAEAWQRSTDLEQRFSQRVAACSVMAARLERPFAALTAPQRPDEEAELEDVEAYERTLRVQVELLDGQHADLGARIAARERAAALSGMAVESQEATAALDDYDAVRRATARDALLHHRDATLRECGIEAGQLSGSTRDLIDEALKEAHLQDQRARLARWIAQDKQRCDGIERALALLQCVPELVQDDALLSRRWAVLSGRLQRIAGSLEAFGPDVDREYEQLRRDARCLVAWSYNSTDWAARMRDQDFEVYQRENGTGLLVVDLDHPEVWLEVNAQRAEEGGVLTTLELKTDAASADEANVTNDICARLGKVAAKSTPKIEAQAEELERKQRITRGVRPAIRRESSP